MPDAPSWTCQVFTAVSAAQNGMVTAQVVLPAGWKVIGGGASANWTSNGKYVIKMWPDSQNTWTAMATDIGYADSGSVTAYAIGLYDPNDIWDVSIFVANESPSETFPQASSSIDAGYALTGGGAWDTTQPNPTGNNLLWASFPDPNTGGLWNAYGRCQVGKGDEPEGNYGISGNMWCCAIGVKPRNPYTWTGNSTILQGSGGDNTNHPTVVYPTDPGVLNGGIVLSAGAYIDSSGNESILNSDSPSYFGNILTAVYPTQSDGQVWQVNAKDHAIPNPGTADISLVVLYGCDVNWN